LIAFSGTAHNLLGGGRKMQRHLIFGIFSYLAMTSFVLAQTATGVIRGTVQDPTGAVLIDVHVMLVDQARNQSWEQTRMRKVFLSFVPCRLVNTGSKLNIPAS
jgi:hypothetical protein